MISSKSSTIMKATFPVRKMVILVGLFGFEPKTSSMSTKRSNQLSYNPMSDECIIHDMRKICKMLFAICKCQVFLGNSFDCR